MASHRLLQKVMEHIRIADNARIVQFQECVELGWLTFEVRLGAGFIDETTESPIAKVLIARPV